MASILSKKKLAKPTEQLKVAIVHHWLVSMRGGERVVEQLCGLFTNVEIFALVADKSRLSETLKQRPIHTSFLQRFGGPRYYKAMLPLFPVAIRSLRLPKDVDVIISSDASLIKGVYNPNNVPHVCYCHSPPRYLWDLKDVYMSQTSGLGFFGRIAFRTNVNRLRRFDRSSARKVDHFVANSFFVKERIRRYYERDAMVIYPPVAVDRFSASEPRGEFYLVVSELVSYKRVDIAIEACVILRKRLVVVGGGAELARLRLLAGPTIEFRGRVSDDELRLLYQRCKAFIHPQIEDFGISAVEAQAAGAPVIAFRAGGAMETVVDGETGLFFDAQASEDLARVLLEFERRSAELKSATCRANSQRFTERNFRERVKHLFQERLLEDLSR